MAAQAFSRPVRVALGALTAAIVLALLAFPLLEGTVAAKGPQHHNQRQQAARKGRDQALQSALRKQGKSKTRKKRKGIAPAGAGSGPMVEPGGAATTGSGPQGVGGGTASSLP